MLLSNSQGHTGTRSFKSHLGVLPEVRCPLRGGTAAAVAEASEHCELRAEREELGGAPEVQAGSHRRTSPGYCK